MHKDLSQPGNSFHEERCFLSVELRRADIQILLNGFDLNVHGTDFLL